MDEQYIIVAYAGAKFAENILGYDPAKGAWLEDSEGNTYRGRKLDIKSVYDERGEALEDSQKLNEAHPDRFYDVCTLRKT